MPFSSTGIPACATLRTHLHRRSLPKTGASFFLHFAAPIHPTQPPCLTRIRLYYNLSMPANMLPALWRSSAVTFRALWRIARQVFHEFAGAMFIIFAGFGALAAWRQWKTRPVLWLIGFAIVYVLMMAIFGLVSFRRARRVR
jgi:hypothetical protein